MGLIQRAIEARGIATVSISLRREHTERVKPPRALFLKFPYGHTLGEPFAREQQRRIILDALAALDSIKEPGTIIDLPYRWKREES